MKAVFFLFLGCFLGVASIAQKKKVLESKAVDVPENVSTSFTSLFTVANNNRWTKNYTGNYIASFTNADSLKQTAEYSASGALIKSKIMYAPTAIPETVNSSISSKYATAKITECTKIQMPGVAPYYNVKIIGSDNTAKELLVSEEGTVTD